MLDHDGQPAVQHGHEQDAGDEKEKQKPPIATTTHLEPRAGLGGGLERVGEAAVVVVAGGGGVAGAVALAAGLDPNEGVLEGVAGVGGEGLAEAGAHEVAPVAPGLLLRGLHAVAAGVHDEVGGEVLLLEQRRQRVDVVLLVVVGVALGVGRGRGETEAVVVGDVGGEAAHGGGGPRGGVDLSEELRRGADVGRPPQPAGVACVEVHGYVGQVELGQRVVDALLVGRRRVGALGHVEVCHQVGQRVGLDHQRHRRARVLLQHRRDAVDVRLVVAHPVVRDRVLAVGRRRGAVAVRQVVDDESAHHRRRGPARVQLIDVGEEGVHLRHLGRRVEPGEGPDVGRLGGRRGQAARQRGNGRRRDLRGVVRVGVHLLAREGVGGRGVGRVGRGRIPRHQGHGGSQKGRESGDGVLHAREWVDSSEGQWR